MNHTNQLAELKLEILSYCPLTCVHCSSDSSPTRVEFVDPALVQGLAEEFVSLGGNQIQLSGGEPLEHPGVLDIVESLRAKNIAVILYTTGIRHSGGIQTIGADEALKLKPCLRSAVFSIHGGLD